MDLLGLKEGDVVGAKYRIERVIGSGGMGVVVSASHIELGAKVAIKFMHADALDERNAERFVREARLVCSLRSEHVATVTDLGRLPTGELYMVMEYLEGQDLAILLATKPLLLDVEIAVAYAVQACAGIAEAHAIGVIHRDLKPSNLFLTKRRAGRRGVIKVLDFGLAKHARTVAVAGITSSDDAFGSPAYMSPEQLRSAKHVDERTDVWSMGVTLYELLTKTLPFAAATIPDLCAQILCGDPTPPRTYREMPDGLNGVLLRCLAKSPDERYGSIAELAEALGPFAAPSWRGAATKIRTILEPHSREIESLPPTQDAPAAMPEPVGALAATVLAAPSSNAAHDLSVDVGPAMPAPRTGKPRAVLAAAALGVILGMVGLSAVVVSAIAKPEGPGNAAASAIASTPSLLPSPSPSSARLAHSGDGSPAAPTSAPATTTPAPTMSSEAAKRPPRSPRPSTPRAPASVGPAAYDRP